MIREQPIQTDLLAPTWACPACEGTGRHPDDADRWCFMCRGARVLDFDPDDFTEIPF